MLLPPKVIALCQIQQDGNNIPAIDETPLGEEREDGCCGRTWGGLSIAQVRVRAMRHHARYLQHLPIMPSKRMNKCKRARKGELEDEARKHAEAC